MRKASEEAARIQKEREDADLANHRERVVWLSGPRPCWSDGTPVDSHYRTVLFTQSKEAISRYEGSAA